MPSLGDSAFIFLLALLLFGPKKLPELARQIGKLMGEFRRASNEFRLQMEEELRIAEQTEKQKKIAELQAAAPVAPALPSEAEPPAPTRSGEDHPHLRTAVQDPAGAQIHSQADSQIDTRADSQPNANPEPAPQPIATAGDISIMPPATGLPTPRASSSSSLAPFINAVPRAEAPAPETTPTPAPSEETLHG
jgi:sec-independent protein translocase protein TatB